MFLLGLVNETCLSETYTSLDCFFVGPCDYTDFAVDGVDVTGTPIKYNDDKTHEVKVSVKQVMNGQACFTNDVAEVVK